MSYRNRFGNKTDSCQKESSFGDRDKTARKKHDYSKQDKKRDETTSKCDDSKQSLRHLEKDDDDFKPVGKRRYYNRDGRRYNRQDRIIKPSFTKPETEPETETKSETDTSSPEPEKEKKNVFSINGPGYFKRKAMVEKINKGILMSIDVNIEKLYSEANPIILPFIKQSEIKELNLVIWNYINEIETAHIHIMFDEHESDFMNPSEDKPADLLVSKSNFMIMMSKVLFYQKCIDYITNSISINTPDYPSDRQETINHVGIIGFAIHNDTPDSGVKIYELFHVIVFNMLNLFVQGYAGKAFCFKISPQGNRFNIELRYDLDEFEDVKEAINHIRLIATSFYNKIFSHLICFGCRQEGLKRPFMKYSFDGYVARKKQSESSEEMPKETEESK